MDSVTGDTVKISQISPNFRYVDGITETDKPVICNGSENECIVTLNQTDNYKF
jgi:hypothetical protein